MWLKVKDKKICSRLSSFILNCLRMYSSYNWNPELLLLGRLGDEFQLFLALGNVRYATVITRCLFHKFQHFQRPESWDGFTNYKHLESLVQEPGILLWNPQFFGDLSPIWLVVCVCDGLTNGISAGAMYIYCWVRHTEQFKLPRNVNHALATHILHTRKRGTSLIRSSQVTRRQSPSVWGSLRRQA